MSWLKLKNTVINLDRVEVIFAVLNDDNRIAGFTIWFGYGREKVTITDPEDMETVARAIDFNFTAPRPSEEQIAVGMIAGMLLAAGVEAEDYDAVKQAREILDVVYKTEEE